MEIICDKDLSKITGGFDEEAKTIMGVCAKLNVGKVSGMGIGSGIGMLAGGVVGFYKGVEEFKNHVIENGKNTDGILGAMSIDIKSSLHALVGGLYGGVAGLVAGAAMDKCCEIGSEL